jgi:hypothetical protein
LRRPVVRAAADRDERDLGIELCDRRRFTLDGPDPGLEPLITVAALVGD